MKGTIFDLDGKCAVVTGASSGLGKEMAKTLAAAGARVAVAARRTDRLGDLAAEIEGLGGAAFPVSLDLQDSGSIEQAVAAVEADFSPIDILVNNAGISVEGPFVDISRDQWVRQLDTNVVGLADISRAVVSRMIESGRPGSIVNIASILGVREAPFATAYSASKSAVISLTRSMALELARSSIRVNAILPGIYETELSDWMKDAEHMKAVAARVPQRRAGKAADLEGALLLLASGASAFMTGSTITVDGGHAINSL
jgi:3-oxoacyl-[acyl-carrier protein] reductase